MTEQPIRFLRLQGIARDWSKHDEHSRNIFSVHGFLRLSVTMFLFIFFLITYQTLITVFIAYEPPWMCAQQSVACSESNSSSARSAVYSTATKPIKLYERRCSLNRSDWKFADYNLYEGPHETIVDDVRKE